MTSEDHNRYIAYSFLAYTGFQLLMLLLMCAWFYFIFAGFPTIPGDPGPPMAFFGVFFGIMAIFQLIFTAPAAIAGYAVLKRKPWARLAAIVAGVVSAMSVPFGTAACVYAMWFFFGDQWKEVYGGQAEPRPYSNLSLNDAADWQPADDERVRDSQYEPKPGDWR